MKTMGTIAEENGKATSPDNRTERSQKKDLKVDGIKRS
jgi:hypothetical protein